MNVFTNLDSMGVGAARVRVVLKDGRNLEATVSHCRGSVTRPMSDEDITAKTRAQFADNHARNVLGLSQYRFERRISAQ